MGVDGGKIREVGRGKIIFGQKQDVDAKRYFGIKTEKIYQNWIKNDGEKKVCHLNDRGRGSLLRKKTVSSNVSKKKSRETCLKSSLEALKILVSKVEKKLRCSQGGKNRSPNYKLPNYRLPNYR